MARVRKADTAANGGHGQWGANKSQQQQFTFVNVYFNQQDQQYLADNWEEASSIVFEWIAGIPGGYKLSVSLDKLSNRYNATLSCSVQDDPNCWKTLSVRGATPAAALYGLAYADGVKLDGTWSTGQSDNSALFG